MHYIHNTDIIKIGTFLVKSEDVTENGICWKLPFCA